MSLKEIVKSGDFIALVCIVLFIVSVVLFVPKIPIKYPEINSKPIENVVDNTGYSLTIVNL